MSAGRSSDFEPYHAIRRPLFYFSSTLLPVWIIIVAGCGGSADTVRVQGSASYRGEPVTNASVTFFPPTGRPISAALSEQGKYVIDLPAGEYKVTVNPGLTLPPGWREGDPVPPPKISLPSNYTTQATTVLTASVRPDGELPIDFTLK